MNKLRMFEEQQIKDRKVSEFNVGDTVKVVTKIPEGDKVRLHSFEGTVISRKSSGINARFTVRRISYGEGIERNFALYSPLIEKIDVVRRGKVRRAKLYYLRGKIGKKARIKSA